MLEVVGSSKASSNGSSHSHGRDVSSCGEPHSDEDEDEDEDHEDHEEEAMFAPSQSVQLKAQPTCCRALVRNDPRRTSLRVGGLWFGGLRRAESSWMLQTLAPPQPPTLLLHLLPFFASCLTWLRGTFVQGYYWRNSKNILDWMMIVFIWICTGMWLVLLFLSQSLEIKSEYDLEDNPEELTALTAELESLVNLFRYYRVAAGTLGLILVFKVVVAAGFYPPLRVILRTLTLSVSDSAYFLIVFMGFMGGFAMFAHISAGNYFKDYSTFARSMRTCLDILVGSYDSDPLFERGADSLAIKAFFYGFNFVMVWVLINVFIAIVSDAYMKAMEQYQDSKICELIEHHGSPFSWMCNPFCDFNEDAGSAFIDDLNRIMRGNIADMTLCDDWKATKDKPGEPPHPHTHPHTHKHTHTHTHVSLPSDDCRRCTHSL